MLAETPHVFDACTLVAILHNEPGGRETLPLLKQYPCVIHVVNLCEAYYDLARRSTPEAADRIEHVIRALGLELRAGMASSLWRRAGRLKAELRRLSLADCFALALTQELGGVLVTADHHEFDPIAQAGLCPIHFIR